jgi:predicted acetyltransferase
MNKFIASKITENELFEGIKDSVDYTNFETIYLCSVVIIPEYRRKGLATKSIIKSIKKIIGKRKIRPVLFYWGFSDAGKKACEKVAKIMELEVKSK